MHSKLIKILAIDDIQDNLVTIKALISEVFPDIHVYLATSGMEGLALARAEDPDVILLDIIMPNMDGFEVCMALKNDESVRDIPVVFVTALKGDKENRIRALEAGAEGFLNKPIDESELAAQIRSMVKVKRAHVQARDEKNRLELQVQKRTAELEKELEERLRIEKALQISEDRYKRITEGLTDYLYSVKIENGRATKTKHNDLCERVTGYTANEFANDPYLWFNMIPLEDRGLVTARVDDIFADKQLLPIEHRIIRKDGEVRWVCDMAILHKDIHGHLLSYDGVVKDITERKQSDEALRLAAERWQTTFDAISDELCIISADHRILDINLAGIKSIGLSRDLIVGRKCYELIHCTEKTMPTCPCTTSFVSGKHEECIYEQNGQFYQLHAWPIYGHARQPSMFVHVITNITERKRTEEKLQASEHLFRTIFQEAPLGIALIDSLTGNIYEVNPMFAEIAGRSREKLLSTAWMSITHPEDIQEDLDHMAQMNSGKTNGFTMRNRYIHPDGKVVWIRMTIAPMVVEDKALPRHLCMIQDITEIYLFEARLRQSEKMDAIGQLAGGIAHDFNNVLSGIIGYTDMSLEIVESNSILHKNLHKVLQASERAKRLVKQILTFTRQSNSEKCVIEIQPIVKEVMDLLLASIPSSVCIDSNIQSNAKPILADPTKIHELILNLATNAVYAMDRKGTLTIRISTQTIEKELQGQIHKIPPGEYTLIEVTDTGCGMDEHVLQRAFEPFYTTKPIGEGTGMGLSVVLGVVQSYDGEILVNTEVGYGTSFKIYFPTTTIETATNETNKNFGQWGGTERILFVDDEPMLIEIAEAMLGSQGYTVIGMSSSEEALSYVQQHPNEMDILITDQTMPKMTGIELAKAIRKIRSDLPMILCSGFSLDINPERVAAIGISQVVTKPVSQKMISEVVRNVLDTEKKARVHAHISH